MTIRAPRPAPLRVTQLVLSDAYAGTEAHVLLLSRALRALNVDARLVCGSGNTVLIEGARAHGVPVATLELGRGNLPVDWREATRAVVGWGPQLVHAHLGNSLLCGSLLAAPSRRPLVYTQHFVRPAYRDARGPQAALRGLAHRAIQSRVAAGLAATASIQREMIAHEGFAATRTHVVPLGIDGEAAVAQVWQVGRNLHADLGLPDGATLVVTPARLEESKGHEVLLAAMPEVLHRYPHTYLLLAGTGALEPRLRAMVRAGDERMRAQVRFLGFRRDVPRLLGAAAVCVLPSDKEGFGLVLLEAMAAGIATVACDAGGPGEIVVDGETGLLVPPGQPEAMAVAIVALLDDPMRARAMGAAGARRVAAHFTMQAMAEHTVAVYRLLG